MGLDMYLYKKTYVQNWEHQTQEQQHEITIKKGGEIRTDIKPERISHIVEQVGYWRKFNALHGWFVENCQNGIDECQLSHVSNEKLAEVLSILNQIKADNSKAKELLPTQEGFYFGGTKYDEYYFQDVDETIALLESLSEGDYYYQSSW